MMSSKRSGEKPTWFLLKSTDYQPGKSLVLGRIVRSANPSEIVNPGPLPKIKSEIDSVPKFGVSKTISSDRSANVGLWAKFLEIALIGGEASHEEKDKVTYHVEKLETQLFTPDDDFVSECLEAASVQKHLIGGMFKEKIYMISGLKTATGIRKESTSSKQQDAHFRAKVSGSMAKVPAKVEVSAAASSLNTNSESFDASADFVYAFRLRQIYYKRGKIGTKTTEGQFYNVHSAYQDLEEGDEESEEIAQLRAMGEEEVDAEVDFGLQPFAVVGDVDDECNYVVV